MRNYLWAAYDAKDNAVHNVWAWEKERAKTLICDRHANGEAFPGEHVVRVQVDAYNAVRRAHGFPEIR